MTQRNYIRFAEIIKSERELIDSDPEGVMEYEFDAGQLAGIEKLARRMADYFAEDNSSFKREKFMRACGIE